MPLTNASPENLDGMRQAAALLAAWEGDALGQTRAGYMPTAVAALAEATGIGPDASWEEYREGMQRIVIGLLNLSRHLTYEVATGKGTTPEQVLADVRRDFR